MHLTQSSWTTMFLPVQIQYDINLDELQQPRHNFQINMYHVYLEEILQVPLISLMLTPFCY